MDRTSTVVVDMKKFTDEVELFLKKFTTIYERSACRRRPNADRVKLSSTDPPAAVFDCFCRVFRHFPLSPCPGTLAFPVGGSQKRTLRTIVCLARARGGEQTDSAGTYRRNGRFARQAVAKPTYKFGGIRRFRLPPIPGPRHPAAFVARNILNTTTRRRRVPTNTQQ